MTLTRHQISEYYADPHIRSELLSQIKDGPVMAIQSLPSGDVLHRKRLGKPITITQVSAEDTPDSLKWYTDRRYSEFHPVIGKTTDKAWVDIDPGPNKSLEQLKPLVSDVAKALAKFPSMQDVSIAYSGGRGFHVRGHLNDTQSTDTLRRKLTTFLKDKFKQKGIVFTKPKNNEVRLDTSTLKNKGSIRALYSLNSETGRVALPLTFRNLKTFKPEDADVRRILKQREYAPGVPGSRRTHPLPEKTKEKEWTLAIQEHQAERAGKHWDLRLIDPHTGFAHSWAVPKAGLPQTKDRPFLALQMPTHTSEYALNFGKKGPEAIREGYGKGTVEIKHKEPIKVLSINPDKVKFQRIIKDNVEDYMLFRTKDNAWLLRQLTTTPKTASLMYRTGRWVVFTKLGIAPILDPKKINTLSTSEENNPLETQDENTPIGRLVQSLGQIPSQELHNKETASKRHQTAEERLNRETSWDSPVTIPSHFMDGPTPLVTRGGGFV